jgi:nitroreductase
MMAKMTDNATLNLLLTRRSAKAALLTSPGPSPAELETMLTIAARVPDHKRLVPWRFVVFEGDARARFGAVLADVLAREESEAPSATRLETERQRFLRAPLVIAVVSRTVETKGAPEWEQVLSAGAASMNLCLAANAMGYGTCWITEWYAYSKGVAAALGLGANERVAGFVYVGRQAQAQADRERPVLEQVVTRWQG